jgi:MFS family permease
MNEPIEPTEKLRRSAETSATLSSCCGVLGEVTLTDSAVIILFAGMLGAGDMLALITTSVLPLLNGLCVIPMAWLALRMGAKRLIMRSCALASAAYFMAVSAPWFGAWAPAVLLLGITLCALFLTGFIAGWFPMLDSFLEKDRRTLFFSRMRFSHQLTAVVFLFAVGLAIGKTPPIWALQLVLFIAAIVFIGRAVFIVRIPVFATQKRESAGFKEGLAGAVANKPLLGFSIYLFVLNLASYGTVPLTILYLKRHLAAPDNVTVIISAMALLGMLLGYLCVGRIVKRLGTRSALLAFHAVFALVNMGLFFIGSGGMRTYVTIGALLLVYTFTMAGASIVASTEMMALVSHGNKTMSMACCGAFSCSGSGLSRLLASLVLGCGMLATEWHLGSMKICYYQTLFLFYTAGIVFAAVFLLVVPTIFPKGEYFYDAH